MAAAAPHVAPSERQRADPFKLWTRWDKSNIEAYVRQILTDYYQGTPAQYAASVPALRRVVLEAKNYAKIDAGLRREVAGVLERAVSASSAPAALAVAPSEGWSGRTSMRKYADRARDGKAFKSWNWGPYETRDFMLGMVEYYREGDREGDEPKRAAARAGLIRLHQKNNATYMTVYQRLPLQDNRRVKYVEESRPCTGFAQPREWTPAPHIRPWHCMALPATGAAAGAPVFFDTASA